ncbi:MAG: hypothetical protein AB1430_15815 [Pseudomonadota bacterium]
MRMRAGRTATHQLTHAGLVLSPQRRRRRWFAALALLAGLAAAAAGGFAAGRLQPHDVQRLGSALQDNQALQHGLEQTRLTLRMSEARSQELERQIDTLNQRLRECQEELTFFRKAREGKR